MMCDKFTSRDMSGSIIFNGHCNTLLVIYSGMDHLKYYNMHEFSENLKMK